MADARSFDVSFRTQQLILLAAQTGSFHKAAKSLGIHATAVVRGIDRLEKELGTKIFERSRNHFAVTKAGSFFLREIQEAVAHTERARDLARYHARIERGPFRLGYSAYIHSRLIPVLEMLNAPEISSSARSNGVSSEVQTGVVLECASTPQLVNRVLHGQLHAAIGVLPVADPDLWVKPITRESFCLCISKNHRLAKQPPVMARELDGEVIFFLPRALHPGLYDRTIEYIESVGARPILREIISLPHAMEVVTRNLGVSLLPRSASRLSCMGAAFKPVTDKLLGIETALFLRRDQQDERTQWLLNALVIRLKTDALEQ